MSSDIRSQAAVGLPSSCAGCFSAYVETCATTGLGLDALETALLELANTPSLASGALCMLSAAMFGDEDAQTVAALTLVHLLWSLPIPHSHYADHPLESLVQRSDHAWHPVVPFSFVR